MAASKGEEVLRLLLLLQVMMSSRSVVLSNRNPVNTPLVDTFVFVQLKFDHRMPTPEVSQKTSEAASLNEPMFIVVGEAGTECTGHGGFLADAMLPHLKGKGYTHLENLQGEDCRRFGNTSRYFSNYSLAVFTKASEPVRANKVGTCCHESLPKSTGLLHQKLEVGGNGVWVFFGRVSPHDQRKTVQIKEFVELIKDDPSDIILFGDLITDGLTPLAEGLGEPFEPPCHLVTLNANFQLLSKWLVQHPENIPQPSYKRTALEVMEEGPAEPQKTVWRSQESTDWAKHFFGWKDADLQYLTQRYLNEEKYLQIGWLDSVALRGGVEFVSSHALPEVFAYDHLLTMTVVKISPKPPKAWEAPCVMEAKERKAKKVYENKTSDFWVTMREIWARLRDGPLL